MHTFIALLALMPFEPSHTDAPRVSIRAAKEHYVVGEPIGVRLTIRNPGQRAVRVVTHYPHDPILSVGSPAGGPMKGGTSRAMGYSGPPTDRLIDAGKSWELTLYWPPFVQPPAAGRHRFRVACELEYGDPTGDERLTIDASGVVEFVVDPRDPERLADIYDRYEKRSSENADDHWPSAQAYAALDSVDDPAVIPYLIRMLDIGLLSDGYSPIDKFHDREEGRLAVVKLLRSDDRDKAVWALRRLADWHDVLAVEDVRPFLGSPKVWPRSQALHYLREVRNARFRVFHPEVAKLAESADFAEGMSALAVLGGWDDAAGAAVPARLSRAVATLDAAKRDEVRGVLEAAAAWRLDIGRARLETMLKDRNWAVANGFAVECYAEAMGRADYSELLRKARNVEDTPK